MWKVLDDPDAAESPKVRATLRFLRKMTLEPEALGPEDARAVLAEGVSKRALMDAVHVAYLFNIYDRMADTMGWDVPAIDSGAYESSADNLLKRGYLI